MLSFIVRLGPQNLNQDIGLYTINCCEPDGQNVDTAGATWTHIWDGVHLLTVPNLVAAGGTFSVKRTIGGMPWVQGEVVAARGRSTVGVRDATVTVE